MPYAEVIYEPGSKSVVHYDNLDELKAGLKEHHRRAVNGEPGASQNQTERTDLDQDYLNGMPTIDRMMDRPAERVTKVIDYGDAHPGDYGDDGKVKAAAVNILIDGMTNDGEKDHVDVNQLISALRDEMSPTFPQDQGRHKSMYKADGNELDLAFLDSGDSDVE